MPFTKLYVHVVFGTRRRIPLLEKSVKEIMIKHILSHGREKGICIDTINGTEDHLHLLIRLQSTQTIAKVMHSIKGQSAWWCNSNKLTDQKLAWAKGYYAASISPEILSRTRRYIRNQELHHFKLAQQYLLVISEPKESATLGPPINNKPK